MKAEGIKGCAMKGYSLDVRNEKLEIVQEYVKLVARGNINCLFLFGEGGIGKTETILRTVEREDVKAIYLNGVTTPLELYNFLYEHNGKLIILDDMEGILDNKRAVSFMKAATYGYKGKRILCYPTNSSLLRAPEAFEFVGRVIFCMNKVPTDTALEALYKRTIYYELKLSFDEKRDLFQQITELEYPGIKLGKRRMVCEFLLERLTESSKDVSLRDLFKAFEIYKFDTRNWKNLVLRLIRVDTDMEAYLRCARTTDKIMPQIRMFREMTGKSKNTFYRIRRKLENI